MDVPMLRRAKSVPHTIASAKERTPRKSSLFTPAAFPEEFFPSISAAQTSSSSSSEAPSPSATLTSPFLSTASGPTPTPSTTPPIILTVSRRHVRKNKYVEVAGNYHLHLLTQNKTLPLVVPRTPLLAPLVTPTFLNHISGLLLTEGEDISPKYFRGLLLNEEEKKVVADKHRSDSECDVWKDDLEFMLVKECLRRGVPILGICRGAQVVNLCRGGEMYEDVELQLERDRKKRGLFRYKQVKHIDYDDYDGYRHELFVDKFSPCHGWYKDDFEMERDHLMVTSYHHQGIRRLGKGLKEMAWSADGLTEGYCNVDYKPKNGKFIVGLQFHPERMQSAESALRDKAMGVSKEQFEYKGCPEVYRDFCEAAWAYHRRQGGGEETQIEK